MSLCSPVYPVQKAANVDLYNYIIKLYIYIYTLKPRKGKVVILHIYRYIYIWSIVETNKCRSLLGPFCSHGSGWNRFNPWFWGYHQLKKPPYSNHSVIVTPGVDWKYIYGNTWTFKYEAYRKNQSHQQHVLLSSTYWTIHWTIHLGHPKLEPVFTQGQF